MLKYKKFFFSSFLIKPSLGNLHDICCRIKLQKENSLAFSLNLISIHIQKLNCLFSKTVWPAVAPRWLIFDWNFKITERCTHVQLQKRHTHTHRGLTRSSDQLSQLERTDFPPPSILLSLFLSSIPSSPPSLHPRASCLSPPPTAGPSSPLYLHPPPHHHPWELRACSSRALL